MSYSNIAFKKNPHNLKVGKLYRLVWSNSFTATSATLHCRIEPTTNEKRTILSDLHSTEPFLVIQLDVYVCRIITGDGKKAYFSYRDHWRDPADEDYALNINRYRFEELKEEE